MLRTSPLRRRVRVALVSALLMSGIAVALPALADDGGVAWNVRTTDGEHGSARGNFTFDVQPGDVIADAMTVINTGTVPLPLDVYAADAFTAASGNIDLLEGGTPSVDAGTWVTPGVGQVNLGPGEEAQIPFTITVPTDATPGDHSAGLVTSYISHDPSAVLEVDRRLGIRIHLRVAGTLAPAVSVTLDSTEAVPSFNPFAPTTIRVAYRVENTGNTRITGSETIDAHTVAGLLGTQHVEPQLPEILPRSTIEVVREVPVSSLGWVGGELTVAAEGVGLGAGSVPAVVLPFSLVAIPWALIALIVLVAGATVAVLLRVRAIRRSRAAADEGASAAT